MRKPVVLITGAGGEIGHGLVTRLAGRRLADHHARRQPARRLARAAGGARVHRVDHRRRRCSIACSRSSRSSACFTSPRCCRRGPSSRRSPRITSTSRARSTCSSSRSTQGESHGRPVRLHLSVVDRRLRPARASRRRRAPAPVTEDQFAHPTTMYGCNKLYCEQLGHYYARHYKQLSADAIGARRFPLRAVSRTDLGDDAAVGRHVGLRAGDDPRGGARASRTTASSGPTRRFRSWRCRTASTRCWRWRRRRASG